MKNPYINKLGMYLVVLTVLDKFSAVIAAVPAAVKLVARFKGIVAEINSRSSEVDKGTSGETNAKTKAEDDMSEAVSILVGVLHSYATEVEDEELMKKSDVTDSDIDRKRDVERGPFCTSLIDMVEEHKAELAEFGVAEEDIANARALIKAYEDSLGKRDSTKVEHESQRKSIAALFRSADRLLNRQLDKMVANMKNADMKQAYEAARVIRDVAATRKGDVEEVAETPEEAK